MKKLFTCLAVVLFGAAMWSCSPYDDEELREAVDDLNDRVEAMEEAVRSQFGHRNPSETGGGTAKEYDSHFGNQDRKRLYHQLFRRHDGNDYQRNQCSVHIGHKRRRRAVLLGARRPNHRNRRAENKGRRFRRHHPAATHQFRYERVGDVARRHDLDADGRHSPKGRTATRCSRRWRTAIRKWFSRSLTGRRPLSYRKLRRLGSHSSFPRPCPGAAPMWTITTYSHSVKSANFRLRAT